MQLPCADVGRLPQPCPCTSFGLRRRPVFCPATHPKQSVLVKPNAAPGTGHREMAKLQELFKKYGEQELTEKMLS